jgi:hypothetical protein
VECAAFSHMVSARGGHTQLHVGKKQAPGGTADCSGKTQGGVNRKRREHSAMAGMMLQQDGSRHEWVAGQQWDLIVPTV